MEEGELGSADDSVGAGHAAGVRMVSVPAFVVPVDVHVQINGCAIDTPTVHVSERRFNIYINSAALFT